MKEMIPTETVEQLIASSRPRASFFRGPSLVLMGLIVITATLFLSPELFGSEGPLAWLLPQVVLIVIVALFVVIARRQRETARLMSAGIEAVQLRKWSDARKNLEQLLQRQMPHPRARAASLLALAAVAEADQNYVASQRIYETVLAEEEADALQMHVAKIALVASMFRNGQTADAVTLSDRLSRTELSGALKAQIELLMLFRDVVMGQTTDALSHAEERRNLFRSYLGTRAAYGYGLLAAIFDRAQQPEQAHKEWQNATLLVRAGELVERFGELSPIAEKYPATEWPI
jgi:hypothetical protein